MKLNKEDIESLFVDQYTKMVGFARKFVSPAEAEDIVQDVFFQLLKNVDKLTLTNSLESYVYRSIKNKYMDMHKSQSVRSSYLERAISELQVEELDYYNPQNHKSLLFNDDELAVFAAIERLPEKCRAVLKSKYFEDKRPNEISAELGISVRTVETHIYKALKQLKVAFKVVCWAHLVLLFLK
jgi:RNA polymerase sigma-70 factor (family 1)